MKRSFILLAAVMVFGLLVCAPSAAVTIRLAPIVLAGTKPVPVIVTTKACAHPLAEATINDFLYQEPTIALETGATGTSIMHIAVSELGHLSSVSLQSSSGNRWLDFAAMESAKSAVFTPRVENCNKVASEYLYVVSV